MKHRLIALFCLVALLPSIFLTQTAATDNLYFIAINDTLPDLSTEIMPILVQGITYIPCTVFDRRVAGVSLNVFYGQNITAGTATLYTREKLLEFNIAAGTAYDYAGGKTYFYQAIIRNGLTYVPAAAVCLYFGLTCSFLNTDSGALLRIKNEEAVLNDSMLISSAGPLLSSRLNQYQQNQTSPSPVVPTNPNTPSTQPQESKNPTPNTNGTPIPEEPEEGAGSGIRVYLAIRVEHRRDLTGILNALKQSRSKALFFFHPEDLVEYDSMLRQIMGDGHRVGLIPGSNAREASICQGNEMLQHILRQNTYFVLGDGTVETRDVWEKRGYLCWSPSTIAEDYNNTALFCRSVLDNLKSRKYSARVLMDDRTSGTAFSELIRQLGSNGYNIRIPRETDF